MKSFSSKERKELLKRWNERNNKNANTTTNAKTNAKTLLNSSNSDGSMSLKEEGKGTPRDDEEENEKQIGNSKTFESRSSRSAGKTSTSKDEYDRDFRSKNADVRNNGSISSSSSGVLRQRQEEAQQNVLMKRKKLSRDAENQRGTKDFAPDDEDWRMQSRNVWLSSYYNTNKSNVVVAPTADDNTNEGGDVLDPNDFDDAFITRRGVEDGFVSKGQRKEESGREENIPNNNTIAAEERKTHEHRGDDFIKIKNVFSRRKRGQISPLHASDGTSGDEDENRKRRTNESIETSRRSANERTFNAEEISRKRANAKQEVGERLREFEGEKIDRGARAGSVFRASLAGGSGKGKSTPRDCKDEIEKHSSLERTQVYDRSARGNAGAVAKRIGNEREDGFGRGEEVRRDDERTKRDGGTFGKRQRKVEIDGGKIHRPKAKLESD
jgi:hypothetical protein